MSVLQEEVAVATRELERLSQLAEDMRAQLFDLQRNLAKAHQDVDGNHGAKLLEANAQLVQAALLAQAEAATALKSLNALSHIGHEDPLTGVPTRAVMLKHLENAIALARGQQTWLAVVLFDVDTLRQINHAHGRKAGDEVLQRVAKRLQSVARHSDTVSRYGGDEFVVVLSELSDAADAVKVVGKMMSALALPDGSGDESLAISTSAGVALFPADGDDPATLLENADQAMHAARRKGPGGYALHGSPAPETSVPATAGARGRAQRASERELREANTQLLVTALQAQTAEADAREGHRRQIQYMAMVAHELRNPLTPIRVAASLLSGRGLADTPTLGRLQSIIEGRVEHMARLIEDLLEGSRISLGKLRMEFRRVDLGEILDLAVQTSAPGIEARQQSMTLQLGVEPLPLQGDPERLVQVFCNLLDNASKYTPKGGAIVLAVTRSDDQLTISVRDNGAGITPPGLLKIFDLFVQDDHALEFDSRGLGIGLAVVRDLVHAHGGTVTAHSEGKGKGSEFVVTLPYRLPHGNESGKG